MRASARSSYASAVEPSGCSLGQIGARPVEDGHEVVAQHRNAQLAHGADALAVLVEQAIARGTPELDVLVHRDALDDGELHSVAIDHLAEAFELGLRPRVADRHVVQRGDDAGDAGDLSDVRQRDRVVGPEPAEGHVHRANGGKVCDRE